MAKSILRPPRLQTLEIGSDRSASWLELFYDLVFVVAVANAGHRLLDEVTLRGVLEFIGIMVPIWWAWASFTFYADRYDTDDLGHRTLAVAQMIAIVAMATSISGDVADSTTAFAIAYVGARLVLIAMYARARLHVPETRDLVTGYIKGFSIDAAIWLISAFVPTPWRFYLWAIGLAISFGTPYYYRRIQAKVPLDTSHLPERFGLFTILVLGESIAAVVAGLAHEGWHPRPALAALIGVIVASSLWWLYFNNSEGSVVRRRPEQRTAWKPTAWIYSHLPLAIALVATAIGLESIIAHEHLSRSELWLVCGGVAAALIAMATIHISTESADETRRDIQKAQIRLASASGMLVLGVVLGLAAEPDAMVAAVIIAAVVMGQVIADVAIDHHASAEVAV